MTLTINSNNRSCKNNNNNNFRKNNSNLINNNNSNLMNNNNSINSINLISLINSINPIHHKQKVISIREDSLDSCHWRLLILIKIVRGFI